MAFTDGQKSSQLWQIFFFMHKKSKAAITLDTILFASRQVCEHDEFL